MSSQAKVDPQNYFQVLEHKYAISLESQGQASNISSEISGALPLNNPSEIYSRGGITTQTKCTSEESKTTRKDQVPASRLIALAEQATSNQEVVKLYQNYTQTSMGNQYIKNTQWQRKQSGLDEMINELVSESSEGGKQPLVPSFEVIEVRVSQNKLHVELDEMDSDQSSPNEATEEHPDSSESSKASNKHIVGSNKREDPRMMPR